ncbi:hypothetical protein Baya_16233 [Bagarius yarrelli]|uniref:Uncharacterized protein n=1 Tax=Bagarius yarrelli TaxID=175774 RepID=A0A556VVC9_BAGYA|nr:hypothetical protein Baya_16233 [Bagarius yarrelli]
MQTIQWKFNATVRPPGTLHTLSLSLPSVAQGCVLPTGGWHLGDQELWSRQLNLSREKREEPDCRSEAEAEVLDSGDDGLPVTDRNVLDVVLKVVTLVTCSRLWDQTDTPTLISRGPVNQLLRVCFHLEQRRSSAPLRPKQVPGLLTEEPVMLIPPSLIRLSARHAPLLPHTTSGGAK